MRATESFHIASGVGWFRFPAASNERMADRMNLLTVSSIEEGHGAYARQRRMADALLIAGHNVVWAAPGIKDCSGIRYVKMTPNRMGAGLLGMPFMLNRLVNDHYELIEHIDVIFTVSDYWAFILKRHPVLKKKPLVLFQRSDAVHVQLFNIFHPIRIGDVIFRPIALLVYFPLLWFILKKVEKIVVQAHFLRRKLLSRTPAFLKPDIIILPNDCPDVQKGRSEPEIEKRFDLPIFKIGLIAPMYWDGKGIGFFLKVIEQLHGDCFKAFLIGKGPDLNRINRRIEKSALLRERVLAMGFIQDAYRYMKNLDLMVIPTRMVDACPNVLMEAMGAGVMILASDIDAHREILVSDKLLFTKDDLPGCRKKIETLMESSEKRTINRALVRERKNRYTFNWNKCIVEIVEKAN